MKKIDRPYQCCESGPVLWIAFIAWFFFVVIIPLIVKAVK